MPATKALKPRQRLGKYRIERRLGVGGFAAVYRAFDTIEGRSVALKVPHGEWIDDETLDLFRREVRLTAVLDHPNILPLKNAQFIDDHFVIATPLGTETLAERLKRRITTQKVLDYIRQLLDAVACAHRHRVIHCDIKPDNVIVFPGDRIRLADFGIARVAQRTVMASGSGTVGYLAPEQALGRPSVRSDVFSIGLLCYRMLTGSVPEWPFDWPPEGIERLDAKAHPAFVRFLRKSMRVRQQQRYANAIEMREAFGRLATAKRLVAPARRRAR